jgi:hypothetical protein
MRIKYITVATIGLCVGYIAKNVLGVSKDVAKGVNEGINPSLARKSYFSKVTDYRRAKRQQEISKTIANLTNLQ